MSISPDIQYYSVVTRYLTTDGTNIYVVDEVSIRKVVISTGVVTTFAGSLQYAEGTTDATGTSARFKGPKGITTDGNYLYVPDNGLVIRKIVISSGVVTTIAGSVNSSGSTDATGINARFSGLDGITLDGTNL